jgi:hypothetical protein
MENQKNKCPICRQKIEHKPTPPGTTGKTKNNKGYYLLEMKLKTVTRESLGKTSDAGPLGR